MNKTYLCIDLKTFYASVECVERGLDPFQVALVVADKTRGPGAITLAISTKLKQQGVRNRCRLYEIPKGIDYLIAKPRMSLYIDYAAQVYAIYLKYIAKEDIYMYSIDEAFLDITSYLTLYEKNAVEIGQMIMDDIRNTLHLYVSIGIGDNLYLAKVALDILAKHSSNQMAYLSETLYRKQLWHHTPLTDFWQIGSKIQKRLYAYSIQTMHDITMCPPSVLIKEFGVKGQYLIDHAWGKEETTMHDIKRYQTSQQSISNSQILFEDYTYEEAYIVVKEMIESNVLQLVKHKVVCDKISIRVRYSKESHKSSGKSKTLQHKTNSYAYLKKELIQLYEETTSKVHYIRSIAISFGHILDEKLATFDLFSDHEQLEKEKQLQETILLIKDKYGKNAILKGMNVQEKATARQRNKLIGGHNAK